MSAQPMADQLARGWDALTPSQRRVAALVVEGLTNPEIGAELGIDAATVKSHLRQVYAKLGLRGRTALAVQLCRGDVGA